MSAGVPVVATDVEGLKDVIRNGENGLLVPLNDLEALTCAIESLLLKPLMRLSLAVSARKVVEENHSIEKCVKEFEECALSLFQNCELGKS
jgi:glycosyltransferase involved in cell wall biosynthesis